MRSKLEYKIFFVLGLIIVLFSSVIAIKLEISLVTGSILSFYGALGMLLDDYFIRLTEAKKSEEN